MATVYYDDDADLGLIQSRKIAVLGYGSQGHAHALSLHDSGCDVRVGLPAGSKSRAKAAEAGLTVGTPEQVCAWADLVMVLTPDTGQRHLYAEAIAPSLKAGDALFFAHGFNMHFGYITPPSDVDVAMVAPKAPGHTVRWQYEAGQGTPVLVAVAQDASGKAWDLVKSYAKAIGGTKAGALVTTFQEETESDLFGEQAVLCGGVTALVNMGFETLVAAGYQPEVAYFECLHELKLIVDLMQAGGMNWMRYSVSDTAEYGDLTRGPRVISEPTREAMAKILTDIRSGDFAREWIAEDDAGPAELRAAPQGSVDQPDRASRPPATPDDELARRADRPRGARLMPDHVRNYVVAHLPGDGIGPEVTAVARDLVDQAGKQHGFSIDWRDCPLGSEYYHKTGHVLPDNELSELRKSDSVLLGAVGSPSVPPGVLERGLLLRLRFELDLYVNLRPARLRPGVASLHGDSASLERGRRPREHRRALRRRGRLGPSGHGLRDRDRGVAEHAGRRGAVRSLRGGTGGQARRQADAGPQDQRADQRRQFVDAGRPGGGRARPASSLTTRTWTRLACTWSATQAGST